MPRKVAEKCGKARNYWKCAKILHFEKIVGICEEVMKFAKQCGFTLKVGKSRKWVEFHQYFIGVSNAFRTLHVLDIFS